MSRRYPGGLITKTPVVPTTSAAPGVWTLDQAITYINAGAWPIGGPYWIGLLGGGSGAYGYSAAVDASGNLYICGYATAGGFRLAKYSVSGTIQWQRSLTSGSGDVAYSIAVDSSSNVYVCGYTNAGTNYIQIAKYDTSGTIQWQRSLGGSNETGLSVAVDSSGNVYVSGYTGANGAYPEIQLAKYNTSGTIQWQRRLGSTGSAAFGYSVAVDSSGNVYVCGSSAATGTDDIQLAKYNTSGTIQWQRRLRSASSTDQGNSIAVDSSGNVYICGYSTETGNGEIQIAKYNTSGTIQWQRSLGTSTVVDIGESIAVDTFGNIYVCGTAYPVSDTYCQIAKYDTSGNIQWQRSLNSADAEYGKSIAVDSSGNFYICGQSYAGGGVKFLFAKLPGDGSLTGTYTVGGNSFTYAATSLTDAASSLTSATSILTAATSTLTSATSTLTDAASTLTSSVTTL